MVPIQTLAVGMNICTDRGVDRLRQTYCSRTIPTEGSSLVPEEREFVFATDDLIDLQRRNSRRSLTAIRLLVILGDQVWIGRQRYQCLDLLRYGIETVRRNDVVWKWIGYDLTVRRCSARGGIVDLVRKDRTAERIGADLVPPQYRAEIAAPECFG